MSRDITLGTGSQKVFKLPQTARPLHRWTVIWIRPGGKSPFATSDPGEEHSCHPAIAVMLSVERLRSRSFWPLNVQIQLK